MRLIAIFLTLSMCNALTESSMTASSAQLAAASANMGFYSIFFFDYNYNQPQYSSYMSQHSMTLPQDVKNYFFHLQALPGTADLAEDVAENFPFTTFNTFISAFPWYSTLLSDASMSTLYLPQYFVTDATTATQNEITATQSQPSITANFANSTSRVSSSLHSAAANITQSIDSTTSVARTSSGSSFSENRGHICQWSLSSIFLILMSLLL